MVNTLNKTPDSEENEGTNRRGFIKALGAIGLGAAVGNEACGGDVRYDNPIAEATDAGPEGCDAGPEDADAGPEGCDGGPEGCDGGPEGCDGGPEGCDGGPEGCSQ